MIYTVMFYALFRVSFCFVDHDINGHDVVVFVNVQPASLYHNSRLSAFKRYIISQLPANQPPKLIVANNDTESIKFTLILPALYFYRNELKGYKWIMFCQEETRLELKKLYTLLSEIDYDQPELIGYAMKDHERTIIHHFAQPYSIMFPHRQVGFVLSVGLVELILREMDREWNKPEKYDTHIDPEYEVIKFIRDKLSPHFQMTNSSEFCLSSEPDMLCSTWITPNAYLPDCGSSIDQNDYLVAVKTCSKFFRSRIPVIKRTWTQDVENIIYFADVDDAKIPTVSTGIPNTETGHCGKLQKILQMLAIDSRWINIRFLVIVDDDTLLSVSRLKQLLYCYRQDEKVAIGERYAYMSWFGSGYDYLTGGSGIVLSMSVVRNIAKLSFCQSNEWPDDMTLGMWLDDANQSIIHSPLFHQARPEDYPFQRIKTEKPISFHKFWETNPDLIYRTYLNNSNTLDSFSGFHDDAFDVTWRDEL